MKLGKTKNMMNYLVALLLLSFVGCLSESVNRKASGALDGALQPKESGISILTSCACKAGKVVDGSSSACSSQCSSATSSTQYTTFITLALGSDITNAIYKDKNATISKPLTSICKMSGYKCQLTIEAGTKSDELVALSPKTIGGTGSGSVLIVSDNSTSSKIQLNGVLNKMINKLNVEVLFNAASIYQSDDININLFPGDGVLETKNLRQVYSYTCLYANQIYNTQTKLAFYKNTFEAFHYSALSIPQYIYQNFDANSGLVKWPFLCHTAPGTWTWDPTNLLPVLDAASIEIPVSAPVLPAARMNNIDTKIKFWTSLNTDFDDFAKVSGIDGINYVIDQRIYNDYQKNYMSEGDWQSYPLFREFITFDKPVDDDITLDQDGNRVLEIHASSLGFYLEPQPTGYSTARSSFRCPSKTDLQNADNGRLASIKKVLSSPTAGTLRFSTKPFFALCSPGKTLVTGPKTTDRFQTARRIIYLSLDELVAKGFNEQDIMSGITNKTLTVNYQHSYDVEAAKFTLLKPSLALQNLSDCSNNHASIPDEGLIVGCYPVAEQP